VVKEFDLSDRPRRVRGNSGNKPSLGPFVLRLVLIGHYLMAGVVGLLVTQGNWSRKGEPIRLCLMSGATALLLAAVLLSVRRPWSWWVTLFSLAAAFGAFAVATVGFVWLGDPNRWDGNAAFVAPIAAGVVILAWLFVVFAALCGVAAIAGMIVLLLPATRRGFLSGHCEASGQRAKPVAETDREQAGKSSGW
jgi:hypothetical protein